MTTIVQIPKNLLRVQPRPDPLIPGYLPKIAKKARRLRYGPLALGYLAVSAWLLYKGLNKAVVGKAAIPWGYYVLCDTRGRPFMADTGGTCTGTNIKGWSSDFVAACSTNTNCTGLLSPATLPTTSFPLGRPVNATWWDARMVLATSAQGRARRRVTRTTPVALLMPDPQPMTPWVPTVWPKDWWDLETPGKPEVDPNVRRALPARPGAFPSESPWPDETTPSPEPAPAEYDWPLNPRAPYPFIITVIPSVGDAVGVGTTTRPSPHSGTLSPSPSVTPSTDPIFTPLPPGGSPVRPPRPGEKETKVRSRGQKAGALILSVVDAISEGAEVVDCFYKQLPKATRDRWARKAADYVGEEFTSARAVESARVVDRPKAYGIQGADWKASALWHNWEQLGNVEINAALECVVVNHISDKFIGAAIGAKNKLTRQRNQIRALRGGGKRRWGARHTKGR